MEIKEFERHLKGLLLQGVMGWSNTLLKAQLKNVKHKFVAENLVYFVLRHHLLAHFSSLIDKHIIWALYS